MKLDMNLTSLGESSSAADWVEQARRKEVEKKKQLAEKLREEYENQLRMAEGEDETVPIKRSNMSAYGSSDLKGMKVMHDTSAFDHDQGEVILTLADTSVVAKDEYGKVMGVNEGDEDILENVNLAEQDRRINREKQLKRVRAGIYSGYDDDEFAEGVVPGAKRSILAHYDSAKPSGPRLTLGDDGMLNIASSSSAAATAVANAEHKNFVSLKMEVKPATSFMTMAEVKKRRSGKPKATMRMRPRVEEEEGDFDLSNLPAEGAPTSATSATAASANGYASAEATAAENMDVEGAVEVKLESKQPASTAAPQQQKPRAPRREWVGEMEADDDLAAALAKARAIAVQKSLAAQSTDSGASKALELLQTHAPDLEDRVADPDSIEVDTEGRRADGSLVFNSTVEFATRLQATLNEKARQRAETAARDMEHAVAMAEANEAISMTSSRRPRSVGGASSQGGEEKKMDVQVQDVDDEDLSDDDFDFDPEDMKRAEESDVDDEDSQLGFLHHQPLASKGLSAALELLRGSGELRHKDELAGRANDQRQIDPSSIDNGVKIEYRDEFGRKLTQKEAFRQLSYRFHGYGPGKKKREKKLKQLSVQQALSSRSHILDGDAGTMKSLTTAQEATGKAHIVVQGGVHASQQQIATLAAQMAQAKAAKERKKASKKTT